MRSCPNQSPPSPPKPTNNVPPPPPLLNKSKEVVSNKEIQSTPKSKISSEGPNGIRPRKPCNCTKSQCLKLMTIYRNHVAFKPSLHFLSLFSSMKTIQVLRLLCQWRILLPVQL
ncbi:hypothetical protein J6590_053598 [Homalodisca vitripennis]|nr:hypothetical protein J6590_053598 [Homalodisca vitripennis]